MFAALRWPPLLSSQLLSCLPHLCQTPELFVMDDLVIKWERCWVSDRSLRSTWPSVIPISFHTHTHTLAHVHTHSHMQKWSNSLLHVCASLQSVCMCSHIHNYRQATHNNQKCTGIVSTTRTYTAWCQYVCILSYPLLIFPNPPLLFPDLPDTRCFIFPREKLAPETFGGADCSIHKFAVKHFYMPKLWCVTAYAMYFCLCRMQLYVWTYWYRKSQCSINALWIHHNSLDFAGSNDSAGQIIGLMKCKKKSVRALFLYQIHISSPYCSYHYWLTEKRVW